MSGDAFRNEELLREIKALIEQGRREVAVTVNAAMTMLY